MSNVTLSSGALDILDVACVLPKDERLAIALHLWASLEPSKLSATQRHEIAQRIEAIGVGTAIRITNEAVWNALKEKFGPFSSA